LTPVDKRSRPTFLSMAQMYVYNIFIYGGREYTKLYTEREKDDERKREREIQFPPSTNEVFMKSLDKFAKPALA